MYVVKRGSREACNQEQPRDPSGAAVARAN